MLGLFNNLFKDPEAVGNTQVLDKDDVIDLLGEDVDEKKDDVIDLDDKKKKESKDDKEEEEEEKDEDKEEDEEDELKEIEEDLEEPDEEKLELTTPARRRDILSKYPKLFKDFPYLETAYYREQKFTEVFSNPKDAQVASEKAATLDGFEESIMGGSLKEVLTAAKEEDNDSFHRIVDNYLPNLLEVDKESYFHVIGNVVKDTIISMAREAKTLGKEQGEALSNAAVILNQFVFGTSSFTGPQLLSKTGKTEDTSKEQELKEKEQKFLMTQFETHKNDLQTRVDNTLKNTIDGNIDPKGSMTDYVKKTACREAFEMLEDVLEKDVRFAAILDKLWQRAFDTDFSQRAKDDIRAAYLSKAKTLLPTVIKKVRINALKGMGKRVREDEEETTTEQKDKSGPIERGRPRSEGKIKSAKDIPRDMKSIDFLMQD